MEGWQETSKECLRKEIDVQKVEELKRKGSGNKIHMLLYHGLMCMSSFFLLSPKCFGLIGGIFNDGKL